ncbi:sugar transferase [Cellulomonas sp. P24]|uniref:sugar transferase n=1 Tax=Cellulomonas sp. P24 TaxID=2885206 RepID=UPI00216B2FB9|nr:sugar transferase [Cellulomonas sp. P24]MCR6493751.1 sugar transferase [Cellulomonas sp. P24]
MTLAADRRPGRTGGEQDSLDAALGVQASRAEAAERRRAALGRRVSWASSRPFEIDSAEREHARRGQSWHEQEVTYLLSTLARDIVLCTFVPTTVLFLIHGTSALQLWWGVAIGLVFVAMIAVERGYERTGLGDGPLEFEAVLRGGGLTAAALALLSVTFKIEVPRTVMFGALPLVVCVLLFARHFNRRALHRRRAHGDAMKSTLVVGDVASVDRVISDLRSAPYHGYKIAGLCVPSLDVLPRTEDVPLLGTLSDIPQVVVDGGFDVVIVTGAELSGQALRRLSWALQRTQAELVVAPGLVEVFGPRVSLEPTVGLSLIHVRHTESSKVRVLCKRGFDIGLAFAALVACAPLFLIIGLAVRLTSRGPVFFRQTRVGKGGTTFSMLKFRSMVEDAEARLAELQSRNEAEGPLFKLDDDPRVTRVGRFLRKHSLDELPQLINVVRGEMALVGPRPPLPREVEQYGEAMRRRLLVRPGATGLWQISGRTELSWEDAVKLDLRYVENWSIALDLMILWKTVNVVIGGHGGR